ncbi:hypothetical protein LOAG_00187 [Loa loa]|uniref:BPTI/Kunitz inhibitor domain-containing protein n=1 Tax=Loa loa TaxID=7209 RepID=A0A1S0UC01_LOALO|nr:hypothetical protein LOAG_00187 [Loa loa]EFO28294.1 hypothetical protein LOAG_00187 [Loa loa]
MSYNDIEQDSSTFFIHIAIKTTKTVLLSKNIASKLVIVITEIKRNGNNELKCIFQQQQSGVEQLCLLSIDRGACSGHQTRYAFDRQQNQCVSFEYTGCGGNLNNFRSLADCISTCGQVGF